MGDLYDDKNGPQLKTIRLKVNGKIPLRLKARNVLQRS